VKGVGQVGCQVPPGVDSEERGLAVAPGAALLDTLGDRDAEVGYGRAVVGEAQLGLVYEVADDGGVVVAGHQALLLLVLR